MRKLLKYFKGYEVESLCAPFFKIIEAVFELMVPFVVASIIDKGIPAGDRGYIVAMCGVLVLLGAVGLGSTLAAQYFAAKGAVGFSCSLRQALFDHIQSLGFSEIDKAGTSTLITRLTSDLNQVQSGVNWTLRLLMRSPFIVFGAMIMAFTIDIKAALVFVVIIPVLSIIVFGIMLACMPLYSKVQAKLDGVMSITRENLTGARVIRAFCKEDEETAEFIKRNEEHSKLSQFVGKISAIMNPVTIVIVNIGIIVLIYIGAIRVESGALTQGMVIALYNYMSQILIELVKLANLIITITKSLACAKRIEKVFELTPEAMADDAKGFDKENEYVAEFKDVSFRYDGAAADSLENVSFTLEKGEMLGIIGATGSGKSTLVNLLPRFYDATEGEVKVLGANVKECDRIALRDMIGFVMQKTALFKGSIRDNICLGAKDASDEDVIDALKSAQAWEFVSEKPDGLGYEIEQNGRNLSGGQAQRLSIARALVKKPKILILDDSSSALDFATDAKLRSAIRELEYNPAVVVVSQRVASIMHCDKIIVMEDGAVAGMGTHTELLDNCAEYREIYDSQIKE